MQPPSPLLAGFKARLDDLLADEDPLDAEFTPAQQHARERAAANFRAAGWQLLDEATPQLWQYYRATADGFSIDDCVRYGIPLLEPDSDIWTQVTLANAPSIEVGRTPLEPADAYLSFEGEVTWEPEHGLQLVIEDGLRVCRVGAYDGRLTHGS